jgi:hypothetical protein
MASINASTAGVGGVITTADNTGILNIQTGGTTAITVNASQNVGIGVSSPTCKLDVRGNTFKIYDSGTTNASVVVRNSTTGDSAGLTIQQDGVNTLLYNSSNGYMAFATNATERMRIDSSGNLMVGSTSGTAKLSAYQTNSSFNSVYAEHSGTGGVCLINATNVAYNSGVLGLVTGATAGTGFNFLQGWSSNFGSERFKIVGNGNIQNVNNSYGAISDIKLKENIIDATPKLDKLLQVKIRNYNLKIDPDQKQIGVIAQELESVFPSLIEETEDKDKDNNDLGTTTKAVKYSVFVPILIKAIQEQQQIITDLQESLTNLTSRLEALEGVK